MGTDVRKKVEQRVENYRKALKYLDSCSTFTYDNLVKANQIAGSPIPESDLQRMWKQSPLVLPTGGKPGEVEFIHQKMRSTLIEGISVFERLARELGKPFKDTNAAVRESLRNALDKTAPPPSGVLHAVFKYCIECGEQIPQVAVYCRRCGKRQAETTL